MHGIEENRRKFFYLSTKKAPCRPDSPVRSQNWSVHLDDDYDGGCFRFHYDRFHCPLRLT